ncbi:MAG: neutral/alkaline non-lysosomal ceramidase N-terminal domain-containing protein [Flavobacteriaceae bacterium]
MYNQEYADLKNSSFNGFIGVASADITPPEGIYSRNWGASEYDVSEGVHRPIELTCLIFKSSPSEKPLVLISADLGWWKSSKDELFVREGILRHFSFEPSQLMFCLTHTHASAGICSEDITRPGGHLIPGYLDQIRKAGIDAVESALSSISPANLTWSYGKCDLATNRDLPDRNKDRELVGFNHGREADDTLLVGRITNKEQQILATIVNYACHPTTLAWDNRLISPDYIGAMRETVESHTFAPCLFLQGASGELAPAEQYVGDYEVADKHGRQLGYAVMSVLEGMLPPDVMLAYQEVKESGAPLAIWGRTPYDSDVEFCSQIVEVTLPLKPLPSLAELRHEWQVCTDRVLKERLLRKRLIREAVGDGEVVKIPVWIWRLGNSLLIGQSNEAYSNFQLELRKELSSYAIGVMNIVNGSVGYLPPRNLYDADIYSVWQTPYAAGSLELLINTTVRTSKKIMKGTIL